MDAWKQLHREGGDPSRLIGSRRGQWSPEQRACLRSMVTGRAVPLREYSADGRVVYQYAPGMTWLCSPHCAMEDSPGESIDLPADQERLGGNPIRRGSPKARAVAPDDPSVIVGDEPIVLDGLLGPCDERREVTLRFLESDLADFIITGPSTLVEVDGVNDIDLAVMMYLYVIDIPNASVGIVDGGGRLRHARGYTNKGLYGRESMELFVACPNTLYRSASIAKPITATAIQRLISEGSLVDRSGAPATVETPFRELLSPAVKEAVPESVFRREETGFFSGSILNIDLTKIRLVDLLTHQAGWCERDNECPVDDVWDLSIEFRSMLADPIIHDDSASAASPYTMPLAYHDYTAFALNENSGFAKYNTSSRWVDPATRYAYSNLGYSMLGRILEHAQGESDWTGWYEALDALVLTPLGMRNTKLAWPAVSDRYSGEAPYFTGRYGVDISVMSEADYNDKKELPAAYGGGNRIDALEAAGGLVTSVVDYCRFMTDQRIFSYDYNETTDPTGRLWTVLDRFGVYAIREREDRAVNNDRTLAWWAGSRFGNAETEAATIGSFPSGEHTGSFAGTATSAYLFPPLKRFQTSGYYANAAVVAFLNQDIATTRTVYNGYDDEPDPVLSNVLVDWIVGSMTSFGAVRDLFPRFLF